MPGANANLRGAMQTSHPRARAAAAMLACLTLTLALSLSLSAGATARRAHTGTPPSIWPTFDYDAQRSGVGPAQTGITAANVHSLRHQTLHVPGTVDSSPVELPDLTIGGRQHDAFFVTTSYGRTIAIDATTGHTLWQYAPASVHRLQGSGQITTTTPIIDPNLRFIYVASPDGFVHKLSVTTGRPVWNTRVTWDPTREKIAGALNIEDGSLLVATDGYFGDTPSYQGHLVTIDLTSGHITHVWNSLCSNIHALIHPPRRCSQSDSAIWGRPGTVILPGSGDILVATGNGDFNGRTDWGDSVLELSPSLKLLHNWTPRNQRQLEQDDADLGSTEPALLPVKHGAPLAVQGGKDGILRLLNLSRLDGTRGPAGPRVGGERQRIDAPGPTDVFSQPAVWAPGGRIYLFVANNAGTAAYRLIRGRLHRAWKNTDAGTSPLVAGGLLYVYNQQDGTLEIMNPRSGHIDASLPARPGHWNSPIVANGHIILPEGDANEHSATGTIDIYRLPGA